MVLRIIFGIIHRIQEDEESYIMRSSTLCALQKYNMQMEERKITLAGHVSCKGAMGTAEAKQI
jgi:hypothetical protein